MVQSFSIHFNTHKIKIQSDLNPLNKLTSLTGYFEMIVWPEYEKHLKSFKDREDVVFLNGEATPEKCFQFVLKSLLEEL